eukprot:11704513-Alexandrium_andersonii.AAC.1
MQQRLAAPATAEGSLCMQTQDYTDMLRSEERWQGAHDHTCARTSRRTSTQARRHESMSKRGCARTVMCGRQNGLRLN